MIKHIAIIMDGNGRYATRLNKPRLYGHQKGVANVQKIVEAAYQQNIQYITFYCFSTENWKRPTSEIQHLYDYFLDFLNKTIKSKSKLKARIRVLGDKTFKNVLNEVNFIDFDLIKSKIKEAEETTANNTDINVTLAINYGSDYELDCASEELLKHNKGKIQDYMWSNFLPQVDILIRTSGEIRISNFLMNKINYAELFFVKKNWPRFTKNDLKKIIHEFSNRTIKKGGLKNLNERGNNESSN